MSSHRIEAFLLVMCLVETEEAISRGGNGTSGKLQGEKRLATVEEILNRKVFKTVKVGSR